VNTKIFPNFDVDYREFSGCESYSWCHTAGVIVNTAAYTARVLVLTAYPHLQFIAVYFVMFAHSSPLS